MARATHGISCLEIDWWGVRDKTSIEPVLRLLSTLSDVRMPYIHRRVATAESFGHYLEKWTQRAHADHPILYLGMHGEPGAIFVESDGRKASLELSTLAAHLEGRCRGRVLHFGSCSTLDVHGATLNAFLRKTGAVALLGYRTEVDWLDAAAFEVLLLGQLGSFSMTTRGVRAAEQRVRTRAGGLAKALRLRVVTR